VTGTAGIEGLVLRYGFLYGPGTTYAPGGYSTVKRAPSGSASDDAPTLQPRPLSLKALAGRILGGDS